MLEQLLCKCEAWSSNPSPTKGKEGGKEGEKEERKEGKTDKEATEKESLG
jgi:hypothetical protein